MIIYHWVCNTCGRETKKQSARRGEDIDHPDGWSGYDHHQCEECNKSFEEEVRTKQRVIAEKWRESRAGKGENQL